MGNICFSFLTPYLDDLFGYMAKYMLQWNIIEQRIVPSLKKSPDSNNHLYIRFIIKKSIKQFSGAENIEVMPQHAQHPDINLIENHLKKKSPQHWFVA